MRKVHRRVMFSRYCVRVCVCGCVCVWGGRRRGMCSFFMHVVSVAVGLLYCDNGGAFKGACVWRHAAVAAVHPVGWSMQGQ
jgi:hypothetical protein